MLKPIFILSILSLMILSACSTSSQPESVDTSKFTCDDSVYQLSCPTEGAKIAILKTSLGVIKFRLFPDDVAETVNNFETLANQGKYDNSPFHRVIKDFMIQTGDFENGDGTGGYSYKGPGTTIDEEFSPKLRHLAQAVSMAKTSLPSTTGSQFFIVHAKDGTPWLDDIHSVFGQVYYGTEVVDKIANLETDPGDRPKDVPVIEKALVTTFGSAEDNEYQ